MKKRIPIVFMSLIMCVSIFPNQKFMVSISGNYLKPSDLYFRAVYENYGIYPEIKVGFKIINNFYIWTGYGFFAESGKAEIVKEDTKFTQHSLLCGAGHNGAVSRSAEYKVELGLFFVSYKENTFGEERTGSAMGFVVDGEILFKIGNGFYAFVTTGYSNASDTVEDQKTKLGGYKAGIGIEVRF